MEKHVSATCGRTWVRAGVLAWSAAWLLAGCGGGGSAAPEPGKDPLADSGGTVVVEEEGPTAPPAEAPPSDGIVQAAPNGSYTVPAGSSEVYTLRLPREAQLRTGDTVRLAGASGTSWRIALSDRQYVDTTNLPGNRVPGTFWTPVTVDPAQPTQAWSASATSADGNRIAAAAREGGVYVSQDGGATWTRSDAPVANWWAMSMTPDGVHLAAVPREGLLYTSSDGGLTWTARGTRRFWGGVFVSAGGTRVVALEAGGAIHLSNDGAASFTPVAGTGNTDWRGVAGSQDGERLVAAASLYWGDAARQGVYVSEDGGLTWNRRTIDGAISPTGNWAYVASSHDGTRMAAIDNGGYPWISDDGGRNWSLRFAYSNWAGLAVSGDGAVVSALEPRDDSRNYTGYVFVSPDGGRDTWHWYGENRWYSTVSLSFDGQWMVVGDAGPSGAGGLLYTSQGNRTAIGAQGAIEGGSGTAIELTYRGAGRFTVTGFEGTAFSIR